MQTRILGRTGLEVSEVGIGCGAFGVRNYLRPWDPDAAPAQRRTNEMVHRALELGYNYFDTAPGYGRSEEMAGIALQGHREEVVLATKVSAGQWTPEQIRRSVEASLRRLRTDVIDVLQFHGGWFAGDEADQVLQRGGVETFRLLREEGKVRFLGFTTEGPSGGVERLIDSDAFDVMQVQYSLMYQHACDFEFDMGIMRQAEARNMGIVLMRPFTSGRFQKLMAMAFPRIPEEDVARLLLNYVLSNPLVDVALAGVRDVRAVEQNNAVSDDTASRIDLPALHNPWV